MTTIGLVELLTWDTEFWGIRAARVHGDNDNDLRLADAECADLGIRWASMLAPSVATSLVNSAIRVGYDMVDIRVTLRMTLDSSISDRSVEIAAPDDIEAMASIASTAFPASRFSVDPHLDDNRCADFYDTWLRNSVSGQMADAIVVSRHFGEIDGFMTVRIAKDHTGLLPLVAIRADRRGRGVGRRLLDDALAWFGAQRCRELDVVTQLSNTPAIGLYESVGFRIVESGIWLHRWY